MTFDTHNINSIKNFRGYLLISFSQRYDNKTLFLPIADRNSRKIIYQKSIILIIYHDSKSIIGLIINKEIPYLSLDVFLKRIYPDITIKQNIKQIPIFIGGPFESHKGYIIHSIDYKHTDSINITPSIYLTSNFDIIKNMSTESKPKKKLIAMGAVHWDTKNFFKEISHNKWILQKASSKTVFYSDHQNKWDYILKNRGIKSNNLWGLSSRKKI